MYLHPGVETADTLACHCCKVVAVVAVLNEARDAKTAEQYFDCLATPELATVRRAQGVAVAVIYRWVDGPFVHLSFSLSAESRCAQGKSIQGHILPGCNRSIAIDADGDLRQ